MKTRWLPTVRQLLLALNALVLLLPLLLLVGLRVYDAALVQQTERRLIGESVVIAEAWRDRYVEALGAPPASPAIVRPPAAADDTYAPIDPLTNAGFEVLPALGAPLRRVAVGDGPAWRAGQAIGPLLERVIVFNLSGARVVDASGCIVATSGTDRGECLDHLPEIRRALAGHYAAVVRERVSDEPTPPVWSMRRRGDYRVFTGTPIHHEGRVVGAVRMARTAMAPEEWLWRNRDSMLALAVVCALGIPLFTYTLSHAISRPLRDIEAAARAIADGSAAGPLTPRGLAAREVHGLASSLDRMRDALESRAHFIEAFTSEVGHELKTPVSAIRGAAELLRDGWESMEPAHRQRFLANLEADAERLDGLVRELLTLARIEHTPEPADRIAVASFIETLCERYGSRVTCDVDDAPAEVRMSRERLERAIRNLVENGLTHGGGEVNVSVTGHLGRLRVCVSDRGPGIPPEQRERIFQRFYTTARETGGTGLGLSIVKAVAESRGGDISVASGPNETSFTLTV